MSIEKLEEIPLLEAIQHVWSGTDIIIDAFMCNTITIFKSQSATIAAQEKRIKDLEKEGSCFARTENIKEVRNLNGS